MKFFFTIMLVFYSLSSFAQKMTETQIMNQVDHLYRSKSSYAEVEMLVKNPRYERTLKLKVWSEEMMNTLIEVVFPNKEKGTKTLKKGTQVWNYLPKVDQVVAIPPSMMMSNWMGSDLTNDDLVKQTTLVSHYSGHYVPCRGNLSNELCLELKPKEKTVSVWGKIVLAVQKTDYFPLRQEFYNESQNLVRTFFYSDRKEIQGRSIPTTLKVIMQNNSAQETTLHYNSIDFSAQLESNHFSESQLRRK